MGLLKSVPEDQQPARVPTTTQYEIGSLSDDTGSPWVILELRTPSGEMTVFFRPDAADRFGIDMSRTAAQAKANSILIAGPEHLRAIENGNRQQRRHPGQ